MCLLHDGRVDDGVEECVDLHPLLHGRRVSLAGRRHVVVEEGREGAVRRRHCLRIRRHVREEAITTRDHTDNDNDNYYYYYYKKIFTIDLVEYKNNNNNKYGGHSYYFLFFTLESVQRLSLIN